MAQIKKEAVRKAILESARRHFMQRGYSRTTLAQIAKGAKVTISNIYNYFASKLEIIYALYEPWLLERLEKLERELPPMATPRQKLRQVILAVLRDIPTDQNGFANNVLQAISTRDADEAYSRDLLLKSEALISAILARILPGDRLWLIEDDRFSHLLFMAFDGFAVNYKLNGPSRRVEAIADLMCDLVLGPAPDLTGVPVGAEIEGIT
ncbi:MAG: TetR/AcrR family transcriptional regulator [Rhodospirillales bacterium]|nr:TetR/AcrR family transcriptional regulator [Rhodospirillales bacterium]